MSNALSPGMAVEATRSNSICTCGNCPQIEKGSIYRIAWVDVSPSWEMCPFCGNNDSGVGITGMPPPTSIFGAGFCPCYFRPLGGDIVDISSFRCVPVKETEDA
jgi:hypothetical protein